jgi:hypothetical protein
MRLSVTDRAPAAGRRFCRDRQRGGLPEVFRLVLLLGARRKGLEALFGRTAAAFGAQVPPPSRRGVPSRLRQFALFTRRQAEQALHGWEEESSRDPRGDRVALERRLYRAAYALGAGFRSRLRLSSSAGAMAAARLIYRGLGIDFRGFPNGEVIIRRCAFAPLYTPQVCELVSALDRGLLSGLTDGGQLQFCQRITEGAACCLARLERTTK